LGVGQRQRQIPGAFRAPEQLRMADAAVLHRLQKFLLEVSLPYDRLKLHGANLHKKIELYELEMF
jgi:hypothetical protein